MMARSLACLLLVFCLSFPVQSAAQPVGTDVYGDPLPDGAFVRLGSIRWRHADEVNQIAFSSDGANIVSCSADGWVHCCDSASGKRQRQFRAARAGENPALDNCPTALSVDGRLLATMVEMKGGNTDRILLWRTATGKICGEIKCGRKLPQGASGRLAFSADGKFLAAGDSGGSLRIFDTDTGRERRSLHWGQWQIEGLALSADGKMLVAASSFAKGAALWNVADGAFLRKFSPPKEERMQAVAFSPDGKIVATVTEEGTLQIWDVATGKHLHILRDPKRKRPSWELSPSFLLFSPDGSLLVMGDDTKGDMLLWSTSTGKLVWKIEDVFCPHCASFSPDGKALATGDSANRLRLWDTAGGKERNPLSENEVAFAYPILSPDGRVLAAYGGDHTLRLWSFPSGKPLRTFRGHDYGVLCLAFSADGKQLATGGFDGTIRFHDAATGRQLRKIDAHSRSENGKREACEVSAIAFSPDGKTLASGGFDSRVRLWDVATGKQRHVLEGRRGWVFSVAFSPDGKTIVGGGATDDDCATCLWDAATGKRVRRWKEDGDAAQTLAFSPDGRVLVAAGGLLGYWHIDFVEAANGKALASFDNRETAVLDSFVTSAIRSDGRILALGGYSGVSLWEMGSWRLIRKLRGEWGGCSHLVLTSDGRTLIAGNGDGTIHFWDLTGRADGGRLRPAKLSAQQLEALWTRLDSADPAPAYRAFWELAASPDDAVPFLRSRLHPAARLPQQRASRLITDLGSERFDVREKAAKELAEFREVALPAIRATLAARPQLEKRKRLELLLERAEDELGAPGRLRLWRVLAALEQIQTPAARKLLETLAEGASEAWLTREAKASLQRSSRRSAAKP